MIGMMIGNDRVHFPFSPGGISGLLLGDRFVCLLLPRGSI